MMLGTRMFPAAPGPRSVLKCQTGSVMVVAIIILSMLTIAGVAAVNTGNMELQIASNHYLSVAALYAAESGAVEALERLKCGSAHANYAGDPATNADQWWSAYIISQQGWEPASDDSDYDGNYQNYIPIASDIPMQPLRPIVSSRRYPIW